MSDKIIKKERFREFLKSLQENHEVFVPIKDGEFYTFKPLTDEKDINFDLLNTRLSPKSLLFPQSERMFEYPR